MPFSSSDSITLAASVYDVFAFGEQYMWCG